MFLFAGTIIAIKVFKEDNVIHWQDYLKLLALYVLLHVIRFSMIYTLKWPLNKLGYGLSWAQATVLGYSGLRGAVSLVLALIVWLDIELNTKIRDIILFHTAGIAILTLVINGTTISYLVKKLGLMRMSEAKKKMLKSLIKSYRKEVNVVIEDLKSKHNYGKIDWDSLKELARAEKIRQQIFKNRDIQTEESDLQKTVMMKGEYIGVNDNDYSTEELYLDTKHRYLTCLKGIYWECFQSGQCTSKAVLLLIESANRAVDHAEDPIKDFTFIQTYFQGNIFRK